MTPGGYPTFDEARISCLEMSSYLVRIDSDAANDQVVIYLDKKFLVLKNHCLNF